MWSPSAVHVIVAVTLFKSINCGIPDSARVSYVQTGDFKLGGIFPLNLEGISACGSVPTLTTLQLVEAMVYAVNVINNDANLLPNVTLGFDIRDDCFAEDTALWAAISLIQNDQCTSFENITAGNLVGFVGPVTSTQSVVVGAMCDLLELPSISFGATSDELSDKTRFEFFSRAVPPDSHQGEALADLLKYFNWEYVSIVYFANTYGIQASHAFQSYARERGICIAISLPVGSTQTRRELTEIADALYKSKKAQVVVMFVGSATANNIIKTLQNLDPNFADTITWIGSDFWGYTMSPQTDEILPLGGIFVNFFLPTPSDFEDYFTHLSRETSKGNPWAEMYFEDNSGLDTIGGYVSVGLGGLASAVIDSVYAFAYAIDDILQTLCSKSDDKTNCLSHVNFTGRELLEFIRNTTFEGTRGLFQMDSKGDLSGKYALKNLQMIDGEATLVDIAIWDGANITQKLTIHPEKIVWAGEARVTVPESSCRESCQVGYIVVPLEEKCCWGCRKCRADEIVVNSTECKTCDYTKWPNEDFSYCKNILPTLLDLRHPVVVVILLFSCLGVILCVLTTIGLVIHRDHPQVKASSRELSALNLFGLVLGFVAVFILFLEPTSVTCAVSQAVISLCLTLIYAPTLLKVSRIYRIFDAGKKSAKRPNWIGPREQLTLSTLLLLFQVIIVLLATILDPSKPAFLVPSPPDGHLELYCHFGYGFLTSLIYNLILVVACCYYAFRARKVPDNFNESKFIAGSVYSTLILCLAAFPLYTTAIDIIQKVAAISAAILINAYLTLACLYLHKLYVIRFMDEDDGNEHTSMVGRVGTMNRTRVHPAPATVETNDGTNGPRMS
ncbi:metabotropic glutamate receptor-like [Amphiura filiformis]|uniref:metabotropic glutamate receptor-like n=1 Tax=Amphiura filiformis TaxID=82378 RepID=UPI003B211DA6